MEKGFTKADIVVGVGCVILLFMNMQAISAAGRFVFVDEGRISPDSWTQYYDRPEWWDMPPMRHNSGGTFSFADGHSEYRRWVDERTLSVGGPMPGLQPCNPDLEWVQEHAWGRLGYDPADYGCQ